MVTATEDVREWKPNSVQIPTALIEGYLKRVYEEDDFVQAVVDLYERQTSDDTLPVPPHQPVPEPEELPDSPQVGESDRYSWFNIELRQRFPEHEEVPATTVDNVFSAAGDERGWISDVLDITLDYHNTKYAVARPVGFIISALKKGNPEQAREQAVAIQKYRSTSGNSLVDSALEEARKRIKEPAPEPRQSRLRQLKEEHEQ